MQGDDAHEAKLGNQVGKGGGDGGCRATFVALQNQTLWL